ncbi:MAG: EAL domain-containing protein [Rhodocyclales bacterium]|nr:EAL domain-containing protein [Rhodocyclales bacterium]
MNAPPENELQPLRVLVVEDNPDDALFLVRALKRGYAPEHERVETPEAMCKALEAADWDIVVSDYTMPEFSGLQALELVKRHDPNLPFIIVSGNVGEEVAVGAMRAGAQDYLPKGNLTRLLPAVARELEEAANRRRRLAAEEALRHNQERLNSVLASLGDIVWSVGLPSLRLEYLNPAAEEIYGRPVSDFLGHLESWVEAVHPEDRERMGHYVADTLASGANSAEYRIVRPDGEVRWLFDRAKVVVNERGRKLRIDGIASDITRHKKSQELLYRVAHHDALTGLPNRALMLDRLGQALAQHERTGRMFALVFIDLDRFKTINDSLGHELGDAVLCQAAERLVHCLRSEDTVARLGGDEFGVLLPDIAHGTSIASVAQKLIQAVAPPMRIGAHTIHCTASLGISLFPRDGADAEAMLKNADTAMYEAKRAGRNTVRFYAAEMNAAATHQLELENALRGATERGELELHFQPQIDLGRGGAICGFEALVRWRHPERGLVAPAEFIPLAEETGLIVPIGEWVLREACRRAKGWVETWDLDLRVAVNLSARQFAQPHLPQLVAAALRESGLPAKNLELELTESLVMQDPELSARTLAELKAMGIAIAVDDFGTGYSSLAYLKRFPIDIIKIDKSFVGEITSNPDDAAICTSIIAMAHSLRLKVVAEGVENESQLGFLVQQQCDRVQGFLFSRPVEAQAAGELLRDGRRLEVLLPPAAGPQRTLLLLDDEENILTALKRVFRRDGYQVLTAGSAPQAFELLAAHKVGVIVSDQRMPLMTGTEFLRRVKELYPDTVRIVLSGYTELQSVIEAINAGSIYRFLTKPWDAEQLRSAIRDAFRQQELAEENARLDRRNRDSSARLAELNGQLQELLADKSSRIARDETLIGTTREIFHCVPVPLIGIDDEGMIVLANARAQALWPAALPGTSAADALPEPLAAGPTAGAAPRPVNLGGRRYFAYRERIDPHSGGTGWLITLVPADREATDTAMDRPRAGMAGAFRHQDSP